MFGDQSRKQNLVEYGFRLQAAWIIDPLNLKSLNLYKIKPFLFLQHQLIMKLKHQKVSLLNRLRPTGLLDPVIEVRTSKNQIDNLISEIQIRIDRSKELW